MKRKPIKNKIKKYLLIEVGNTIVLDEPEDSSVWMATLGVVTTFKETKDLIIESLGDNVEGDFDWYIKDNEIDLDYEDSEQVDEEFNNFIEQELHIDLDKVLNKEIFNKAIDESELYKKTFLTDMSYEMCNNLNVYEYFLIKIED